MLRSNGIEEEVQSSENVKRWKAGSLADNSRLECIYHTRQLSTPKKSEKSTREDFMETRRKLWALMELQMGGKASDQSEGEGKKKKKKAAESNS